jgi:dihydroorotate dehydrogenase electron transfer subunit
MDDCGVTPLGCGSAAQPFPIAENRCRVLSNDAVNGEYRLLVAEAPDVALTGQAGQFFHLACPPVGEDHPFLRRPMSIYGIDRARREVSFLYKVQGAGTRGLASLAPGDELNALGPLGQGFAVPAATKHAVLVARGVGLATLGPLAALAAGQGAKVTAVLSARSPEFVMSEDYLRAAGAETITVTDTDGTSDVPALDRLLRDLHARAPIGYFATCGSNRLLRLLQDLSAEWDVPGQVALEQTMGCALGMCFACVRTFRAADGTEAYRRVCWDGPVFTLSEAQPWLI